MLPADRKAPKVPCLNESPSQKEGKLQTVLSTRGFSRASMKAPPKRKGNVSDCPSLGPTATPQ